MLPVAKEEDGLVEEFTSKAAFKQSAAASVPNATDLDRLLDTIREACRYVISSKRPRATGEPQRLANFADLHGPNAFQMFLISTALQIVIVLIAMYCFDRSFALETRRGTSERSNTE